MTGMAVIASRELWVDYTAAVHLEEDHMIRRASLAILFAAVLCATATAIPAETADPRFDAIDTVFERWDRTSSPGCSVAVYEDGEIAFARGYGMANLEHLVPITPETVFYIGSTSKQFAAFAIQLLAEQGTLSLDDDIRKFLPEMPDYGTPITVGHLVHHTSGIRDYLGLWGMTGRSYADSFSEEEVIDLIARQKNLNFSPGEKYLYSNSGYFLMGVIVKRASGLSLREFTTLNMFGPLGMTNTHFHDDHNMIVRHRADGHTELENGEFELVTSSFALVGSGGLHATVRDLLMWDRNFYDNKLGKGGQPLIDRVLIRGVLNDGTELDYASGLMHGSHGGLTTVRHGGAFIGYKAELLRFPGEMVSVAVLCNEGSIDPSGLADQVADIVLADRIVKGGETAVDEPGADFEADPSTFDDYAGRYEVMSGVALEIALDDGRLTASVPTQFQEEMVPTGADAFSIPKLSASALFKRNADGEVEAVDLSISGQQIVAKKLPALPSATPEQLAEYTGSYYSEELESVFRLYMEETELSGRIGYNEPTEILMTAPNALETLGMKLLFTRGSDNAVTGFVIDAGRVTGIRFERR
jgi:CubicO group peptidase (beta-lactamase class C family)